METDNIFGTSDLYFAAYLKVAGVPFEDTEFRDNRIFFLFKKVENMKLLKREYFDRTGKVSALTYADEIKALKTMTHM